MAEMETKYELRDITCKICSDVFTNARDLPCGHTFCLHCLKSNHLEQCPECQEKTVPEENELENLKLNSEKNRLVRLEMNKRSK